MKDTTIKDAVAKGLANILQSLSISNPSGKTKSYIKKISKKLAKQLKAEAKKSSKGKKNKSGAVAKGKAAPKKQVKTVRKKK